MASSGNFCTLNPLASLGGGTPDFGTLSNGNTTVALGDTAFGNIGVTSGKWYWEFVVTSSSPTGQTVGWANEQVNSGAELGYNSPSSATNAQIVYMYLDKNPPEIISDAPKSASSGTDVDLAQKIAQYDIVGLAADFDNDKWYMSIDGSFTDMRSGQNPADGSNPLCSASGGGGLVTIARTAGYVWYPAVGNWAASARTFKVNFGADSSFSGQSSLPGSSANASDANGYGDFYYTPPSGFLALCTANLPISENIDPAQTSTNYPAKQFGVVTYTGTGSSNALTGLGFQPDLVWIKERGATGDHKLTDSSRGVTKSLESNEDTAEATDTNGLTAFGSDGFTVGSDAAYNNSSDTYVAWAWRCAGGTTSTNDTGGTDSTVQVNTASGFSIVKWTGTGSATTLGHGLGVAPKLIIVKDTTNTNDWAVYHGGVASDAQTDYLLLNSYAAVADDATYWNDTAPTSTVFSVGTNADTNTSSAVMIAYVWAEVDGFSRFSSFEGNGNADGPFVYTGFRPRMLIVKDIDRGENWVMFDSERNTYNPVDKGIYPNDGAAETTGSGSGFDVDFLGTGFKLRCTHDNMNGSSTYIYACWGDVPTKYGNTF